MTSEIHVPQIRQTNTIFLREVVEGEEVGGHGSQLQRVVPKVVLRP